MFLTERNNTVLCSSSWRIACLAVTLSAGCAASAAAQAGEENAGHSLRIVAGATGSVSDVALLRAAATELASLSPTFRQMVETIRGAERFAVIVRPVAVLRALGEGRFVVKDAWTVGLVDIGAHRLDYRLRVRALAHELAHATEIACLPRHDTTDELRETLAARAGQSGHRGPMETPFADAIERVVLREATSNSASEGRLGALAAAHDLPSCAALAAVDPVPVRIDLPPR